MTHLNESAIDVCDCCGGDGQFCDTYIDYDHTVRSDFTKCRHCNGEGFVLVAADPADEFWMEEA